MSEFKNYYPITSKKEILEEVKKVLSEPQNNDIDCVSLYDVLNVLKKLGNYHDSVLDGYKEEFNRILKEKSIYTSVSSFYFDYREMILKISFKTGDIYFAKQDDDLYIIKSSSRYDDKIFQALCSNISKMYDELLKYADYYNCELTKNCIKPVNSNFYVDINSWSVSLYFNKLLFVYSEELKLVAGRLGGYELKCNSCVVSEAFNGKEEEILKGIFVKISDCPVWSQNMLHELREKELNEKGIKQLTLTKR